MGWESFPRHAGSGGNGVRQNHTRRGRRPHPSALPHPIAIHTPHFDCKKGKIYSTQYLSSHCNCNLFFLCFFHIIFPKQEKFMKFHSIVLTRKINKNKIELFFLRRQRWRHHKAFLNPFIWIWRYAFDKLYELTLGGCGILERNGERVIDFIESSKPVTTYFIFMQFSKLPLPFFYPLIPFLISYSS